MTMTTTHETYPLTWADAEPYLACFGDDYWFSRGPAVSSNPDYSAMDRSTYRKISGVIGRGVMFKLTGPKPRLVDRLPIDILQGELVKLIVETRHSTPLKQPTDQIAVLGHRDDNGFMVAVNDSFMAMSYGQHAYWYIAQSTKRGGAALFPLAVDHAESYSSGVEDSYNPALKLVGIDPNAGIPDAVVGQTIYPTGDPSLLERASRAMVYDVMPEPGRRPVFHHQFRF